MAGHVKGRARRRSKPDLEQLPACPLFRTRFCNSSSARVLLCWRPGCAVVCLHLGKCSLRARTCKDHRKHVNHITSMAGHVKGRARRRSKPDLEQLPACPLFRTRFCNSSSARVLLCWRPGCAVSCLHLANVLYEPTLARTTGSMSTISPRWPGMSREGLGDARSQTLSSCPHVRSSAHDFVTPHQQGFFFAGGLAARLRACTWQMFSTSPHLQGPREACQPYHLDGRACQGKG